MEVRGPEYVDEAVIIGKSGAKIPHSVCEECKKPKAALYDMGRRRICMDCYEGSPAPPDTGEPLMGWYDPEEHAREMLENTIIRERVALTLATETLEAYEACDAWGDTNKTKTSTYWRGGGAGFGPARRTLKHIKEILDGSEEEVERPDPD